MSLFAVGVNHATAPVEIRERLAVSPERQIESLRVLARDAALDEVMLLSTCNRVEIYAQAPKSSSERILDTFANMRGTSMSTIRPHCFMNGGPCAAQHIFRVTASLESMVIGEPQILGQVKDAYRRAGEGGTLGAVLHRCLTMAFRGAKRVRSETEIGRGGASVPSVTVDLARRIFGGLDSSRVCILGAGEMAQQTAIYMAGAGVQRLRVVNRHEGRGRALAESIGGDYVAWRELEDELSRSDIVVASTGAPSTIIDGPMMRSVLKKRRFAPIFLIDIAVPRDVEAKVGDLDGVFLYDIDDLRAMVDANMKQRVAQTRAAHAVIDSEVADFLNWTRRRDVGPTIRALRQHTRSIVDAEIERALTRAGPLEPGQREAFETMSHTLVNKLLHLPLTNMKKAFEDGDAAPDSGDQLASATRALFNLEASDVTPGEPSEPPQRESKS